MKTAEKMLIVMIVAVLFLFGLGVFASSLEQISLANLENAIAFVESQGYYVYASPTGGNVTTFLELTDTPISFTGEGGKYVKVADNETELEFAAETGGTTNFTGLSDTPAEGEDK